MNLAQRPMKTTQAITKLLIRDDDVWGADGAIFRTQEECDEFLSTDDWLDDGKTEWYEIPEPLQAGLAEQWDAGMRTSIAFDRWLTHQGYQRIWDSNRHGRWNFRISQVSL